MRRTRFNSGESRPCFWFKEVGNNFKEFGRDTFDTYLKQPVQKKDAVQAVMGPVGVALNTLLTAPDALIAGIADKKLETPKGTRTGRDIGEFVNDVVTLHPIRAVLDVIRLPGSFGMDAFDAVGGFRNGTRSKVEQTLAA